MGKLRRHRVLYLNPAASGEDPGPAQHALAVARHLLHLDVDVKIFPRQRDHYTGRISRVRPLLKSLKSAVRSLLPFEFASFIRGMARTALQLPRLARLSREQRATVILARHYDYEWLPWLAARLLRLPLVLEVNSPFYLERRLHGRRSPGFLRWMERIQWRRADALYVVSTELRQILVDRDGVRADRIHVVPNGVELADFPSPTLREGSVVTVIFSGGFYRWHGVQELVRAFAAAVHQAPTMRLELVGEGPESAAVAELVRSLGIDQLVELKGRIGRTALVSRLYAADIAVAPYQVDSDFYFSPLKIMEYMAAGLAVIAPAQGQIREVVSDGCDGLLYPQSDMDALRACLVKLANDGTLRLKMSRGARAKAEEALGWDRAAARLVVIFDTLRDNADGVEP